MATAFATKRPRDEDDGDGAVEPEFKRVAYMRDDGTWDLDRMPFEEVCEEFDDDGDAFTSVHENWVPEAVRGPLSNVEIRNGKWTDKPINVGELLAPQLIRSIDDAYAGMRGMVKARNKVAFENVIKQLMAATEVIVGVYGRMWAAKGKVDLATGDAIPSDYILNWDGVMHDDDDEEEEEEEKRV